MKKHMQWKLQSTHSPENLVALRQLLLKNLGQVSAEEFFSPRLPEEFALSELGFTPGVEQTILKRLEQAIAAQEQIVIFGDYDADGICATAILWESLHACGARVVPFLPQRQKHGYGLSVIALQEVLQRWPDVKLIITVDNGIVAHKALQFLADQKIEVIVSDHHQPDGQTPQALAIFHSDQMCGAAVAWFLSRSLVKHFAATQMSDFLAREIELVAIATVTDLMPLLGINRSFLWHGLRALHQSQRPGLVALFALAQVEQSMIDTYTLGFIIGPRLNAMGRLGDATEALRLLCTTQSHKAQEYAKKLQLTNTDRQNLTQELITLAQAQVTAQQNEKILIIDHPDFHEGIIGLLAGRLLEQYQKPAIVISSAGQVAKASARSLPGFHITDFIREFQSQLLEFGGHPLAAGFAVASDKIPAVKQAMLERARQILAKQTLERNLDIAAVLPESLVSMATAQEIQKFAPFGLANPQPLFLLTRCAIHNYQALGKSGEHWRLTICPAEKELEMVVFKRPHLLQELDFTKKYDLVVSLDLNTWHGRQKLQLCLKDWRLATEP